MRLTSATNIKIDSEDHLYFSGTSYLGLNYHEAYIEIIKKGLSIHGTNYGGSRKSPHSPDFYREFESYFAQLHQFEAALLCTSGTLAAHLVIQEIPEKDVILLLKGAHPCIGLKYTNKHIVFDQLDQLLEFVNDLTPSSTKYHLIIEHIDAIQVKSILGPWLENIKPKHKISIIIDDSHGIGILNIHHQLKYIEPNIDVVVIASLGKAFSTPKGVVFSSSTYKNKMITTGLWGGSSPGSIADIYALLFGADIISRQQGLLKTNIEYFKSIVKIEQFRYLPEFPVFMPLIMGTSKILLNHKIVISAFSYPTENDPLIERIVINASHTKEQIDQLVLTL